ncbi:S8 family peptidase [Candidatus Entotheonella palauensis]|uniref:S8 family peptidase n=1 Tax=Candidatus Entotheonella palauensis TaxID=93172 RepID=UPI000B7F171B|nr:S8 family peptidase [Candidatus Entotheonella palauensis]
MIDAYLYSYAGVLVATLWWYILESRDKATTYAKGLFFLSALSYLLLLLWSDGTWFGKVLWFARDAGMFLCTVLIGHYLARRTAMLSAAVAGLVFLLKLIYLPALPALAPQGELLFDIKQHGQLQQIKQALAPYGVKITRAFPRLKHPAYSELDDFYVVDVPRSQLRKLPRITRQLYRTGAVDWVEHNEMIHVTPILSDRSTPSGGSSKIPSKVINDPHVDKQWAIGPFDIVKLHQRFKKQGIRPKKTAKIAILDTGIDATHPDLKANYTSTSSKYDSDKQGHGTHCAGIAAAVTNNKVGIASMIPGHKFVTITSIKVLNDQGGGTQKGIIDGIIQAADTGADVLSMSLGGPSSDDRQRAYEEAIKYANKAGAIVVVAAGNSNQDARQHLPAGAKGVITVSAVDTELQKAAFSNRVDKVAMGIAGPGVDIYSTFPGNSYRSLNGTSMAAPFVASVVGMMKAIKPKLTTKEAYQILKRTGQSTQDSKMTGPLIQPLKALKSM